MPANIHQNTLRTGEYTSKCPNASPGLAYVHWPVRGDMVILYPECLEIGSAHMIFVEEWLWNSLVGQATKDTHGSSGRAESDLVAQLGYKIRG
jgi:hypothetical protein